MKTVVAVQHVGFEDLGTFATVLAERGFEISDVEAGAGAPFDRARRVVAKAEHLEKGENPRFVVTSLSRESWPAQAL